ncbi:hypothetical protein [Nocardia macrotermitis]|uniref:Type IV secretory pathway, VirB4 components n=1 Tax=Nocardia macrotermitis TaxID=2585198 RepID=A0A7K0DAK6_9NOCA|nr:hypothetical protein [Nocardia macrotermitis]MQY21914.1 hypothetical protein [Nocardia macrotermitis]
MAGDDGDAPIRYRGEPPRYRERVVDTSNPLPGGGRGLRREDDWNVEAYTPGQPRTAMPADWDDAPVRPPRRGSSGLGSGRGRSNTPPERRPRRAEEDRGATGRDADVEARSRSRDAAAPRDRRPVREDATSDRMAIESSTAREQTVTARERSTSRAGTIPALDAPAANGTTPADGTARDDGTDQANSGTSASGATAPNGTTSGNGAVPAGDATARGRENPGSGTAGSVDTGRAPADVTAGTSKRDTISRPTTARERGAEQPADRSGGAARGTEQRTRGREDMPDGQGGRRQRPPQELPEQMGPPDPRATRSRPDSNGLSGNGSHPEQQRADAGHLTRSRAPMSERNRRRVTDRNGGDGARTTTPRPDRTTRSGSAARSGAAARKGKGGKQTKQGPPLLDELTRARLELTAREGAGLRAAWATFRIRTDDLRRMNAAARLESVDEDGFDRTTAQLTDRGYLGAGGGRMNVVGRPVEYRATTAQVAGLWPWSVGAGAPLIGTPLGSHLHTGAPVCFDPMNWFMRGSFITAPSLFVLGLNGFGKSSLVRRIVLGGIAQGITPLILADVKPDYRKLVEMVGGQVIDLGYGHGKLNPLAGGVLGSVVPLLSELPAMQVQVLQELRARQVTLIAGLVELVRGARVRDYEETLISTGLSILYREGSGFAPENPPIMENLLEVIVEGGEQLMLDAGADSPDEYHESIKGLRRSLRALTQGPFGAVFNGQTSTPIDTSSVAVCIDVSHIPTGDKKLKAAVMLACWADGFASVEAAHVLADAEMGAQRYFQVVMDELWQVLGLGDFMVDRVDELTRLQRGLATSLIMISHTIKDLQSLGSDAAIAKAIGFLERARAKIFGALPPEEIKRLDSTIPFTSAEEEMVTGWSAPQALTGEALKPGQARPPAPGTGKFLLKIGEDRRPGIPFHMEFTISERESGIHETNQRFSEFTESTARRGGDTAPSGDEGSAA